MSTPALPSVIAASTTIDDPSALTSPGSIRSSEESWFTPHSLSLSVFKLTSRMGKHVSSVWKYFHMIESVKDNQHPNTWKEGKKYACCNKCGEAIVVATVTKNSKVEWTNGGLKSHLRKHKTTVEELEAASAASGAGTKRKMYQGDILKMMNDTANPLEVKPSDRKKHQLLMMTRFVSDTLVPFNIVEKESFNNMIRSFDPRAKPVSGNKVRDTLVMLEFNMRELAINTMKNSTVSLTLDHWTSKANQNYTGLTAHFVDSSWCLHSLELGIFLHEGATTASHLESSFGVLMAELELNCEIFAITTDTTANMNSFGEKMEKKNIVHLYCSDHLLHLSCRLCYDKAAGTAFGEYGGSVKKARDIVSFFNKSTQAVEKLKMKQQALDSCPNPPVTVVTDVVTRWWSTFAMIERLLVLKPAIDVMAQDNQLGNNAPLDQADWHNLKCIKKVLEPFQVAQKILEGDKYITSSWVLPAVKNCRSQLAKFASAEEESASKTLSLNLLEDFEKRWGKNTEFNASVQRGFGNRQIGIHPAFLLASFFDPKYKNLSLLPDNLSKDAIKERVLVLMKVSELRHREKNSSPPMEAASQQVPDSSSTVNMADSDDDVEGNESPSDFLAALEKEVAKGDAQVLAGNSSTSVHDICDNELTRYLAAPSLPIRSKDGHNNSLDWWKNNQYHFPILARLARIYLPIQATSAPSERIFSRASRIISNLRTGLSPNLAGRLLFVSSNWDWYQEQVTLQQTLARMTE